jgi:hypothetical protein|tara:strand:- start:980 stop:1318 length:339 start_codon:yes stop_codon:yes gene_type:complete
LGEPLVFSSDLDISVSNIRFSPNKIAFDLDADDCGWVVLNQNFTRGSSLSGAETPVLELGKKSAARLSPGTCGNLAFKFFPKSIWCGLAFICLGVLTAFAQLFLRYVPVKAR